MKCENQMCFPDSSNRTNKTECEERPKCKRHKPAQVNDAYLDIEENVYFVEPNEDEFLTSSKEFLASINVCGCQECQSKAQDSCTTIYDCPKKSGYTGMFCDGVRHTDYVLVINEYDGPEIDLHKKKFLFGLVRLGLHLEFQRGKMQGHTNLLFIKIHAPDKVLDRFAEPLGMKKYYKDTHLKHMGGCHTGDEILLSPERERAWLQLVRERYIKPMKFSNCERSMIVYFLLINHICDRKRNHLGLKRLLSHEIILDAYALHDGPYFFVDGQDYTKVNARQILYYNWTGPENIYRYQPKHLIQEYFGSKIGFFFTFYEFYNKFLFILAVAGLVLQLFQMTRSWLFRVEEIERYLRGDFYKDMSNRAVYICPECSNFTLCPFRNSKDYIPLVGWYVLHDNGYTVVYCIFVLLWAGIFYVCWRRHEMFYIWIWEQNHPAVNNYTPIIRPEHEIKHGQDLTKKKEGRWNDRERFHFRVLRYAAGGAVALAIITVACLVFYKYFLLHIEWSGMYQVKDSQLCGDRTLTGTHKILAVLTVMFYVIMFVMELVGRRLVRAALMLENHRTQNGHERRQAALLFSLACLSCFPIPMFFGWIKGAFYVYPRENSELFNINCGAYGWCVDQFILSIFILTTLRIVLWKTFQFWPGCWKTDFSMSPHRLERLTSWERESVLRPVTDVQIVEYYNEIVLQFAIVVLLSPWFPLMPLIAFLINWCDIKYKASLFLKYSRRPTLFPTDGIMQWNNILRGIILVIPIVHAISMIRNLRTGLLNTYLVIGDHQLSWRSQFNLSEFYFTGASKIFNERLDNYTGFKPPQKKCSFIGAYGYDYRKFEQRPFPVHLKSFAEKDYLTEAHESVYLRKMYDIAFVSRYSIASILVLLVILYLVPLEIPWVLRYMQIEKTLKRLHVVNKIQIPEVDIPASEYRKRESIINKI